MPQALIGFERSVQLIVSWLHDVVENPRIPMPDRMFQVATLKVRGAFCASMVELGVKGPAESDPWHAPPIQIRASARTDRFKDRLSIMAGGWLARSPPPPRWGARDRGSPPSLASIRTPYGEAAGSLPSGA
jgi:hypothetical protein